MNNDWLSHEYAAERRQRVKEYNLKEKQEKHTQTLDDLWKAGHILPADRTAWHAQNQGNNNRARMVQTVANAYGIKIRDWEKVYTPESCLLLKDKRLLLLAGKSNQPRRSIT